VMVANVVNLHAIPKMFRNIAARTMRKTYQENGANLPEGLKPEDYVLILPDWDGKVTQAAGFKDVNQTLGVAILSQTGDLEWTGQGNGLIEKTLSILEADA